MNLDIMYNTVEEYLVDDDFIKYVLDGEMNEWSEIVQKANVRSDVLERAKRILLATDDVVSDFDKQDSKELKQRVFTTLGLQ